MSKDKYEMRIDVQKEYMDKFLMGRPPTKENLIEVVNEMITVYNWVYDESKNGRKILSKKPGVLESQTEPKEMIFNPLRNVFNKK